MSLALAIAVVMMNVIDTTSASITASISIVVIYMIAFRVAFGIRTMYGHGCPYMVLLYAISQLESSLTMTGDDGYAYGYPRRHKPIRAHV